ncbi:Uncharacterised protein [Vibrio cholerae]|nr:Uncharacterised protein [Vibrio cholerae]
MVTFRINRNTDHTSRHGAFVRITCCHESRVWAAITHRYTKALSRTNYDICAHFTRRFEQHAGE